MFRSRNDAVRTAPATLGDADNAGRKRSAIRSALTLTAVAVGITAGSVLGVSPANAVTRASGPLLRSAPARSETARCRPSSSSSAMTPGSWAPPSALKASATFAA